MILNFFIELLIICCNISFSMDLFSINLYHGGKFLEKSFWSYIGAYWGTRIFIVWISFIL